MDGINTSNNVNQPNQQAMTNPQGGQMSQTEMTQQAARQMHENLQQQAMQQQMQQQPAIDVNAIASQLGQSLNQSLEQRLGEFEEKLSAQQNQMTPEQREEMNYKLREEFENDPMAFMDKIRNEAQQNAVNTLRQEYEPIINQTRQLNDKLSWQDQVRQFIGENPESQSYLSQMSMILQENPALMQTANPLATAYQMATARDFMGNGGDIVSNILGNDNYRNKIMQNEELRNAIISDYQNRLNGNNSSMGLPSMMGNNQSGTSIPASAGEQPRNLREAKMAALRRMQAMNNPQGM